MNETSGCEYNLMLNSGEKIRVLRDKKINILTLVLSEKNILNETKNHTPTPLQVKWSVPKKAPLRANYSIANYLKTVSKAMVTRILDTLIGNAVNHSKIVATEIIDDILKGAVKTDNNSTKRKHSVTDKTFVTCLTWKEKFP